MSLVIKSVWGHILRPWGYEVRVDFVDVDDSIHNEVLTFKTKPSQSELEFAVMSLMSKLELTIAAAKVTEQSKITTLTNEELLSKIVVLEAEKDALIKQAADLSIIKGVK